MPHSQVKDLDAVRSGQVMPLCAQSVQSACLGPTYPQLRGFQVPMSAIVLIANRDTPDRVLINQPLIDEAGMVQDIDPEVFTGSLSSGIMLLDKNCVGWTNGTDAEAVVGFSNRVDGGWLNNGTGFCDNPGHLYCVQR